MSKNAQSKSLRFLYNSVLGRAILKLLTLPFISKICGVYLSSRFSKPLISSFIKRNGIIKEQYYNNDFKTFNDCFSRKIKEEYRPVCNDSDAVISVCDGYLSAYSIDSNTVIPAKQSAYSICDLLNDSALAEKFNGGVCVVIRLGVENYHRYCYVDNAQKGENVFIKGVLHTVRPIALRKYPVFVQNCREYTVLESENLGTVVQMEIGAMLVGKIKNFHGSASVKRGQEKGTFLYGGSTVIMLFEKDKVKLNEEFLNNTAAGVETPVRLGEKIGTRKVM